MNSSNYGCGKIRSIGEEVTRYILLTSNLNIKDITFGETLQPKEKSELTKLISEYSDVFATDPKKPKLTNLTTHSIITDDALPARQKPRRIPKACEQEVDQQLKEMINNEIMRPSTSPWNSPIILV